VLAGDPLCDIASQQLGPTASDVEVALHWPRWYEANKARIGESPHVLLPGQILNAPSTR
jgi:nucleoid-associated protein YgaU